MTSKLVWPDGKRFAFSIFDDTDCTTLDNAPKIYSLLEELGMRTTKSVWPLGGETNMEFGGSTCQDASYLEWVHSLKAKGFEIALHNASYESSSREQAIEGLETFLNLFGTYPNIHANHTGCDDSVYWGDQRLSGIARVLYNLMTGFRRRNAFGGTDPSSKYYWGDRCKRDIKYVRNFVYADINTLKICPQMPYRDVTKPLVNRWFSSSDGHDCKSFCNTISEDNQDRLLAEGGASIMYTHFGVDDFYVNGEINPRFEFLIRRLADKGGWYVPVSTLLDHIAETRGDYTLTSMDRFRMEYRWLFEKAFLSRGTS